MKALRKFFIFILVIVVTLLVVAAFLPKNFSIQRSTTIKADKGVIFNQVNNLSNWGNWSPWKAMDSTMVATMGETFIGVGGSYSWKGEEGVTDYGSLRIASSNPYDSIGTILQYMDYDEGNGGWKFEETEGGTKVIWYMNGGAFPFPLNIFIPFMQGDQEAVFDDGLSRLKEVSENIQAEMEKGMNGTKIEATNIEDIIYIGTRATVSFSEMETFYRNNLGRAFAQAMADSLEMTGAPSGIYYDWNPVDSITDMAAGVPVKSADAVGGGLSIIEVKGGKALVNHYYGPYGVDPHNQLDAYMKAYGIEQNGEVIEEYMTDPTQEPDTSKWYTKVIYKVK